MTSPTQEPRADPTSFKIATIVALLMPVAGLAFMLLMFAIAPQGPEGLGPVILGIAIFGLSIPFAIILLVITASTNAISNRTRKSGAQAAQVEAKAPYTSNQPERDEDDEDNFTIPRAVFIGIVAVATLPLLAGIAGLLGLLHA